MQRLALLSFVFVFGCKPSAHDPDPRLGTGHADAPSSTESQRERWDQAPRVSATPTDDARSKSAGGHAGAEPGAAWDSRDAEFDRMAVEESSPGLGTSFGETHSSSVESVGFRRADPSTPDVVFAVRYDDVDGVRSVARSKRSRAWSDDAMQQRSGLSFALIDEHGDILPAAAVEAELWAVGRPDARYSLAIANDTGSSFEVVASVDGLDVIDGRPASFEKRGYIVDPFSSVVIDGWRTSETTVAAFRFSSIEDSYAERMGDGRNIGVIGAAFFREAPASWDEWRPAEETWRRESADPFPGREW